MKKLNAIQLKYMIEIFFTKPNDESTRVYANLLLTVGYIIIPYNFIPFKSDIKDYITIFPEKEGGYRMTLNHGKFYSSDFFKNTIQTRTEKFTKDGNRLISFGNELNNLL